MPLHRRRIFIMSLGPIVIFIILLSFYQSYTPASLLDDGKTATNMKIVVTTDNTILETTDDHKKTKKESRNPVKVISILGERNSGTTWITKEMRRCFGQNLQVKTNLTRHKHWFQFDDGKIDHDETVVIAQFRNPYEWIAAMIAKPRHTPVHRHLDWKTYLTTPWTMPREKSDYDLYALKHNQTSKSLRQRPPRHFCKQKFYYDDIVSCAFRPYPTEYIFDGKQRTPFYEMMNDGSGVPYGSVLQMRADKIRDHESVGRRLSHFVREVLVTRYEDLVANGTGGLIAAVEGVAGVTSHCEPTPAQTDRVQRKLKKEMVRYINKYGDWDAERLIGYEKMKV